MDPTAFFDVAETLLTCVCNQMDALAATEDNYEGCPCLTYVSAGEPPIDCCDVECPGVAGAVTTHVQSVYPSEPFPDPLATYEPCRHTWVALLVVTASRCAYGVDDEGNLPPVANLNDHARTQSIDTFAILNALICCLPEDPVPGKRKRRVQIQSVTPNVSEGGCASVEVTAAVELGQVCPCAEVS